MKVLSTNVASVGALIGMQDERASRVASAIHKRPVAGSVMVPMGGIAGDEQADRRVHGGRDKAVYAYPSEHYAFWNRHRTTALKRKSLLQPGDVGENLTIEGLLEKEVWIGDSLAIGSVVLQITEPRTPCFKFGIKMGFYHAPKLMHQSGLSGFYLRVLQEGAMQAGDAIELCAGPRTMTIAQLNEQRRTARQRDLF